MYSEKQIQITSESLFAVKKVKLQSPVDIAACHTKTRDTLHLSRR
jgi:hypothetical protein